MTIKSDENIVQYPNNPEIRVALLEQSVTHIHQTLERIEKRFDKIDEKFDKIDDKFDKMDSKFDKIELDLKELRKDLSNKIDSRFFWLLTFTIGGFASLWGTLAHIAHWF